MKELEATDLKEKEQGLLGKLKSTVRRPKKLAPAPENLRGWAKSAVRGRNKS
jgi:hypothetical protein